MAEGYEPQPCIPNTIETVTVTKGADTYVNSAVVYAYKQGKIVIVSGYLLLNANNFDGNIPLVTFSQRPKIDTYSMTDKGEILRVDLLGRLVFHNSISLPVAYRFFNFSYATA